MENNVKRKKPGKGIVFYDLIYARGVKKRMDSHGRPYQTFYFVIGQDMGWMSCSYYGDIQLEDNMCLKLLRGRFCPTRTQQGFFSYLNFRVENFEVWQQPKTQTINYGDFSVDVPADGKIVSENNPEEQKKIDNELNWINEPEEQQEKPKDDGDTLVDINEVTF